MYFSFIFQWACGFTFTHDHVIHMMPRAISGHNGKMHLHFTYIIMFEKDMITCEMYEIFFLWGIYAENTLLMLAVYHTSSVEKVP